MARISIRPCLTPTTPRSRARMRWRSALISNTAPAGVQSGRGQSAAVSASTSAQSMLVWNQLFFTPGTFTPNPNKSAEWNRGAYLAEGLGHCGLCHTPKNCSAATRPPSDCKAMRCRAGSPPTSPTIRAAGLATGRSRRSPAYLKTGHNRTSAGTGLMAEMVGLVDVAPERCRSQGDRGLSEGSAGQRRRRHARPIRSRRTRRR